MPDHQAPASPSSPAGAPPGPPLGVAIEEGQGQQQGNDQPGQDVRSDDFEPAREILEQLEQTEEVPLGPRHVVARTGRRPVRASALPKSASREQRAEYRARHPVIARGVIGKNIPTRPARGVSGPDTRWRRISVQMHPDQPGQYHRQDDDVSRVPARQRQRSELGCRRGEMSARLARAGVSLRDVDRHDRGPVAR